MPLEVAPRGQPAREVDGDRGAGEGGVVDVRAARERQAQQSGDLVEGLARGVVDGGPQRLDRSGHVAHAQQRGVAAGDEHRQARVRQRSVLELVDRHVRGEVVHAVQRLVEAEGQRLRGSDTHQQRAGQPRAGGHGDRVDVLQRHPGGRAGALDRRHHRLEVGARRDLGYDATEPRVLIDRGGDGIGEQGVPAHDADPGLVAGRLDAEHQRCGGRGGGHRAIVPVPRIPASRSTTAVAPSA